MARSTLSVPITRRAHPALGAFLESARRDPQPVDGARHGLDEVEALHLDRVDAELVGDLLEVQLDRESRLGGAVAALRPARRLVREDAQAFESVCRDVLSDCLQTAGVESGRDPA